MLSCRNCTRHQFLALFHDPCALVRHDNARHHGKCRLITPSAISRYKVDGRRALKPPLGPASTSRAGSPPFRFTVSHRLSPGDATRPAAGHEVGGRAEPSRASGERLQTTAEVGRTVRHTSIVSESSLYISLAIFPLSLPSLSLAPFGCPLFPFSLSHQSAPCQFVFVLLPRKSFRMRARACRVIVVMCMHARVCVPAYT